MADRISRMNRSCGFYRLGDKPIPFYLGTTLLTTITEMMPKVLPAVDKHFIYAGLMFGDPNLEYSYEIKNITDNIVIDTDLITPPVSAPFPEPCGVTGVLPSGWNRTLALCEKPGSELWANRFIMVFNYEKAGIDWRYKIIRAKIEFSSGTPPNTLPLGVSLLCLHSLGT